MGWVLIRGCALINFFCRYDVCLISMWILRLGGDRRKKKVKIKFNFVLACEQALLELLRIKLYSV